MTEKVRLQRFLARAGIASRRAAEKLIEAGRVRVNGEVALLGSQVAVAVDRVEVDGRIVVWSKPSLYLLLHKPSGYLTTRKDPQGRSTVLDLLPPDQQRANPVGRLDFNTEGLLLLTDDGELARRLMHPRFKVAKTYRVRVRGRVSEQNRRRLASGVELEDGMTLPAKVRLQRATGSHSWLEIELREGRNRQVRRMCAAVGHSVSRLQRTDFGPLQLGGLPRGQVRSLSPSEIAALQKAVGLS